MIYLLLKDKLLFMFGFTQVLTIFNVCLESRY